MVLPTPLSWLKKTLRILKSNLSPNQIALAFALGVFAGLPPMGLHIIIPCTIALLVRCSFRAFLISIGLFKLVSVALAPAGFALGKWLLDSSRGLDTFWRWLVHLPVLAPMGYGRYLLLGSLAISLLIAVPVFLIVRWLVLRYRTSFATWVAGWRLSAWLRGRRGAKLARRFLTGGEAKYETKPPPKGPFRYVRREMMIGLPILYGICYLLAALIVPFFAGTLTTSTASWVVGSEVAVEDTSFNLFTGGLTLSSFAVQDPQARSENLVEIPAIELDVGMLDLLSKRVVFNRVVISDASLHVKREEDGTLNLDNTTSGWDASGYIEWAAEHASEVDWLGLARSFVEYLGKLPPLGPWTDPYAPYRGGRSFLGFEPPFEIQALEIGRVLVTLEDEFSPDTGGPLPPLTLLEIEVSNLAFPPQLRRDPIQITLRGQLGDDPESGFHLSARFEQQGEEAVTTLEFGLTRIDLARVARIYERTLPVTILSGHASVRGSLLLREMAEASGDASFVLENLVLAGDPARPLFGLPSATSAQVIEGINRYAHEVPIVFGAGVGGASSAPQIEWEAPLLEIAQEGLLMLGERRLNETIESLGLRIDQLGGVDQSLLDPDFAGLQAAAEKAAYGVIEQAGSELLVQLGFESPETQTASENPLEALPQLLQNLFDR